MGFDPSLNNVAPLEDVVFKFENLALTSAVIVDPPPGVQVVARNFRPVGPNVDFVGSPVINDSLVVAVNAANIGVPPRDGTVVGTAFFDGAVPPRPFLTPASPAEIILFFSSGTSDPSINDRGQIAVIAEFDPQGPLVVAISLADLEPFVIADTSDKFAAFTGSPSINNAGTVAFGATLKDGDQGIFVFDLSIAPNAGPIPVIETGDFLFGKQVRALSFGDGSRSLNDLGELVFSATFLDDSQVIVRAHRVPEPSSVSLCMLALGLLVVVARRQHHAIGTHISVRGREAARPSVPLRS